MWGWLRVNCEGGDFEAFTVACLSQPFQQTSRCGGDRNMLGGVAREPIMCLVAYCRMFAAYGRYMFKTV